jgi:hypothetical protein
VSGFSPEWLGLREPLDGSSRNRELALEIAALLRAGERDRMSVVDLGAGTGANLRYLAPVLGGAQDWLLVDRDAELLGAVEQRLREWSPHAVHVSERGLLTVRAAQLECRIERRRMELAAGLEHLELPRGALVTASALLDLVSATWLAEATLRCREAEAPVLLALTYDGRMRCNPAEPDDRLVQQLFNRHQRTDKGFGLAVGPSAAAAAERSLLQAGYRTRSARSDWRIGPGRHAALQLQLIEGWFDAAQELAPAETSRLREWRRRRRAHVEADRSELLVGHVDLIAWLEP